MREHVVHLARDPRALGVADLLDAQLLLGLGAASALALRLAAAAQNMPQATTTAVPSVPVR